MPTSPMDRACSCKLAALNAFQRTSFESTTFKEIGKFSEASSGTTRGLKGVFVHAQEILNVRRGESPKFPSKFLHVKCVTVDG